MPLSSKLRSTESISPHPKPSSLYYQQETDQASQTTARNRLTIPNRNCKLRCIVSREDHQAADWPNHKAVCKNIGPKRAELEAEQEEERMFSALAGSMSTALPMGADAAVLLKLGHAELDVGTRLGVESGLGHILEITKNAKSSMLGVADFAPASFLRLGRDQEAYDFMKWWITTPETIMAPPKQPYTAVKNQDILEPAAVFMGKCPSMAFMATLTLLKLRLLMDLQSLQRSKEDMSAKLPQELVDEIRRNLVSSAISRQLIERDDHREDIARVKADVKVMYEAVKASNIHFWPAVLHPGDNLTAEAEGWYYGNKEEMQFALQFTYRAWFETPGAIEAIEVVEGILVV